MTFREKVDKARSERRKAFIRKVLGNVPGFLFAMIVASLLLMSVFAWFALAVMLL